MRAVGQVKNIVAFARGCCLSPKLDEAAFAGRRGTLPPRDLNPRICDGCAGEYARASIGDPARRSNPCDLGGNARNPLGRARVSVIDGIEYEFHAIRHAELVKNTEQVFLHRVFTQGKFARNIAITHPFGH